LGEGDEWEDIYGKMKGRGWDERYLW